MSLDLIQFKDLTTGSQETQGTKEQGKGHHEEVTNPT